MSSLLAVFLLALFLLVLSFVAGLFRSDSLFAYVLFVLNLFPAVACMVDTSAYQHFLKWMRDYCFVPHQTVYRCACIWRKRIIITLNSLLATCTSIRIVHTSSFTRFARSATSPSFVYVSNPAGAGQLSVRTELLLPDCVHFSCRSPIASIRFNCMLLPVCVRFSYCSPLASALADCVRFNCCSPIASTCSPSCSSMFSNFHSSRSSRFSKLKYEGRTSLVYSPAPRTSHFRHARTHTLKIFIY